MLHLPISSPGASAWIAAAALAIAVALALVSDPVAVSVTDDVAPVAAPAAAAPDPDFLGAQRAEWDRWSGGPRER